MRNNKILTAAIASALSLGSLGLGAGSAAASTIELKLLYPLVLSDGTNDAIGTYNSAGIATDLGPPVVEKPTGPATFATEKFGKPTNAIAMNGCDGGLSAPVDSPAFPPPVGGGFMVGAKFNIPANYKDTTQFVTLKFALNGATGATWGSSGIIAPDQVTYCKNPDMTECDADATVLVNISKGNLPSGPKDSTADFVIQKTTQSFTEESNYFFFTFDVDSLVALQNGGSLGLEASGSFNIGDEKPLSGASVTLAKAAAALKISVVANDDAQRIVVDVTKDNKEILKGSTYTPTFELGHVLIEHQGDVIKHCNGAASYDPLAGEVELTVVGGAFAASKAAGAVYLENIDPKCTDSPIAGTVTGDSTAIWTYEDEDEECFMPIDDETPVKAKIIMKVDGATEIKPLPSAPIGTFTYTTDDGEIIVSNRLRPLKDNGVKCTVYNIPDGTAGEGSVDLVSIRITNKTGLPGFVNASLIDEAGINLFGSSKRIIQELLPNQTVRLYTGVEPAPSVPEYELSQYATRQWGGERAKLVMYSNVQDLEVLATVRNINGGAQMNMSTGATGSGCD